MAETADLQDLENLKADADAAADVVNGAADVNGTGVVTTRLGRNIRTLARIEADANASVAVQVAQATAAAGNAASAASAAGAAQFYDTRAAADAALSGLSGGDVVEVFADEGESGARTRYRVEGGALVLKVVFDRILVREFATLAAVAVASIDAEVVDITVRRGVADGRLVPFGMVRADAEPTHGMKVRSLDRYRSDGVVDATNGGWWTYAPPGVYALVSHAGAVSGVDATAEVQTLLDWGVYGLEGNVAQAVKPALDITDVDVSGMLQLGYGDLFRSIWLCGMGAPYGAGYDNDPLLFGSQITTSVGNAPAIAINAARRSGVEDFTLVGPAAAKLEELVTGPLTYDLVDVQTWIDKAEEVQGVVAQGPHKTGCGVGIDCFTGTEPAEGYPVRPLSAVAVAAGTGQYGVGTSSRVRVGIAIRGFPIAIGIGLGNSNTQGEFCDMTGADIRYCIWGISAGNDQGRSQDASNALFHGVHTLFATNQHGLQGGEIGATQSNISVAQFAVQLFDLAEGALTKTLHLQSARVELLFRIGRLTGVNQWAEPAFKLSTCNIKFAEMADQAIAANLVLGSSNDVGVIEDTELRVKRVAAFTTGDFTLNRCRCEQSEVPAKPYEAAATNVLSGGLVLDPVRRRPFVANVRPRSISTPATTLGQGFTDEAWGVVGRDALIPHAMVAGRCPVVGEWSGKPIYHGVLPPGDVSNANVSGRTITLTNGRLSSEDFGHTEGYLEGSPWVHRESGLVAFVRQVDLATGVTDLEIQNGYRWNGTDFEVLPDIGFDVDTAQWWCHPLIFAPDTLLFGTFTAGSNVITDVETVNGALPADYGLVLGDRLANKAYGRQPFQGSPGPEVTAIDTSAKTITLAGPARFSQSAVPLPFWQPARLAGSSTR